MRNKRVTPSDTVTTSKVTLYKNQHNAVRNTTKVSGFIRIRSN